MAIYNGRQVTINSFVEELNPQVDITQDELDGSKAIVRLSDIQMTDAEKKKFLDHHKRILDETSNRLTPVKTVEKPKKK